MQNGIENVKIRVALLKALHILGQASGGNFGIGSAYARVLHCAYLHHIFVETFAFVGRCNHARGGTKNSGVVKALQRLLNYVIGAGLSVDGQCGKLTTAAIKNFQRNNGLTADGQFGTKSKAKMKEILYGAPVSEDPTLGYEIAHPAEYLENPSFACLDFFNSLKIQLNIKGITSNQLIGYYLCHNNRAISHLFGINDNSFLELNQEIYKCYRKNKKYKFN